MSYVTATVSPAARARSAVGVVAIHALLGAGVVIGLTITEIIVEEDPGIIGINLEDPPEVLPPPTPIESTAPTQTSIITAPERDIDVLIESSRPADPVIPILDAGVILDPRPPEIFIPGPVAPPTFNPVAPLPINGPVGWITNNDYPRRGLTRGLEGTSGYRLVVSSNGRVSECQITRSSGHAVLDDAACRLLERRARFDPAKDNRGQVVVGTYTGQVTWQIPD